MEVIDLHIQTDPTAEAGLLDDVVAILGQHGRGDKGWTREELAEASGMNEIDFKRIYLDTFLRGMCV